MAERLVIDRVRAAVAPDVLVLERVQWLLRDDDAVRNGEADVVIGDPARGILVIEVKSGEIRRDGIGTWWAGPHQLDRSPFEQARENKYKLRQKLFELPDWPADLKPIIGHAVAFPDVDLDTMRGRLGLLGLDADSELIADQSMFVDSDDGRAELRRFLDDAFRSWSGDPARRPPGEAAIDLLRAAGTEPFEIRSMLRNELVEGQHDVVRLTTAQYTLLNFLRGQRRASILGGAGTGKTLLAVEKARRLAREGFRTLLVCFNAPLARMLGDELESVARDTGRLDVKTFHQLCEDLGNEADVLATRPDPVPQEWWDRTLPRALDDAVARLGPRYHAIVVDEGQDFDAEWLASLNELLLAGNEDVLYVFHDPAQAIFRADVVSQLGLTEYPLETNCRNAAPIHAVVARFAEGGLASEALRSGGRAPEFVEAAEGTATVEALRSVLHRLRAKDVEAVNPWDIAVLTAAKLEESAVWLVPGRRYGNEVMGNPAVDDAGKHLGLPAHLAPELPSDVILCETIRRFKGLERPVIILVELREDDPRLERMLYVGASRAQQHLVVIAPAAVLGRLAGAAARADASRPLQVDWVDLSSVPGLRGAASAGGRLGMTGVGGRDLAADALQLHQALGVDSLLLLLEDRELHEAGVPDMAGVGVDLVRFPIRDMDVPSDREALRLTLDDVLRRIRGGGSVVVACWGGLGRTGTVVACLLRDAGLDAGAAIALTRASRPHTIEREAQERFVADWDWPPSEARP